MKKLTLILLLFSLSVTAQNKPSQSINKINPENRFYTLCADTLYVHIAFPKPFEYAKFKLSYLKYKGKVYRYKIAYYDPSLFYAERSQYKKQIKFY